MYPWQHRRDEWRELLVKYQDRILFGSDVSSSQSIDGAIDLIRRIRTLLETEEGTLWGFMPKREPTLGLGVPKQALHKIYHENFERIVGKTPKKLNLEIAIDDCLRMADMMRKAGPWPLTFRNTPESIAETLKQKSKS